MPMPLPRFRLRTLMIAVAVLGLAIAGAVEAKRFGRLASEYRRKAKSHARFEQLSAIFHADSLESARTAARHYESRELLLKRAFPGGAHGISSDDEATRNRLMAASRKVLAHAREMADYYGKLVAYHSRMRRQYERAASCPWESVPPTPPEPPMPKFPMIGIE